MVTPTSPYEAMILATAASLSADLIKAGAKRLSDLAFGTEEERALEHAWESAFQAMLENLSPLLNEDQLRTVRFAIRDFIYSTGVADELLDLALSDTTPEIEKLRNLFSSYEFKYDYATFFQRLELDFDAALQALSNGLAAALLEEAGKPGSSLYQKVNLAFLKKQVEILNELLNGIRAIPTDFSGRFKNFLYEYLGKPEEPVPFGGRDTELESLDRWLLNPDAPPYALIAVEAGRGKSALLVRWSQSLIQRNLAHVVFIPISIRFNTALSSVVFTSLAARLGEIYNDPIKYASMSEQEWRGVCFQYMERTPPDGKPLVMILDGLDEAADWQPGPDLLPFEPPPNVRAVLSARFFAGDYDERAWLRRLGWESPSIAICLPLPPLTQQGVSDVLMVMGDPLDKLATKVDVVGELFRLSEGEPLLIRLYIEALLPYGDQASAIKPEDLPSIENGLKGYFDRWWQDQRHLWGDQSPMREQTVQTVLNLLACALGPLSRNDLFILSGLNTWTLEESLVSLRRFVIGDGDKIGYSFSHPRLRYYFLEKMAPSDHDILDRIFLNYGKGTIESLKSGDMQPEEAPSYCLQYYGAHLDRSDANYLDLYEIVNKKWMCAWYEYEGTYSGFLNDVARAWNHADVEFISGNRIEAFCQQIRCALCLSSVASLSANFSSILLKQSVKLELISPRQAIVIAKQISDYRQLSRALVSIVPLFPINLINEVLEAALAIRGEYARTRALTGLAEYLSEEQIGAALEAALAIRNENFRVRALIGLMEHLSEEQKMRGVTAALEAALAIRNEYFRVTSLIELGKHLSEEQIGTALEAALAIPDDYARAIALTGLVDYLSEEKKREVVTAALEAALAIRNEYIRVTSLIELGKHLSEEQKCAALETAQSIQDDYDCARALTGLVEHLSEEKKREVVTAALAIPDDYARAIALTGLVDYLSEEKKREVVTAALEDALAIPADYARASALTGLGEYLSEEQKGAALKAALTIRDELTRARALIRLAEHQSEEQILETLNAALAIRDELTRAFALTGLADHLSEEQKRKSVNAALEAALAIPDDYSRAKALTGLAEHLSEEQKGEVITAALEATKSIQDEGARAIALTELVEHLSDEQIVAALEAALAIQDEYFRDSVLTGLVEHLSDEQIRAALEATKSIQDEDARASAFTELFEHLAEEQKMEVVTAALEAALAIRDEHARAPALTGLVEHLSEEQIVAALEAALAIRDELTRANALTGLAKHLSEEQIVAALETALVILDDFARAIALTGLAEHLSEEQKRKSVNAALEAALTIRDEYFRDRALTGLAEYLSEEQIGAALEVALAIQDDYDRARALTGLAEHLSEEQKGEVITAALEAALAIQDRFKRSTMLDILIPILVQPETMNHIDSICIWKNALHALSRYPRNEFINKLVILFPFMFSFFPNQDKEDAALSVFTAIREVCQWWS